MTRLSRSARTLNHGERRAFVVHELLWGVFDAQFTSGQRLVVQRLSEQYGVSPTPVREALVELEGIGIVELIPNCGAVVRPFGPREVAEICHLRRLLEGEAARCATGHIPPPALAELAGEFQSLVEQSGSPDWLDRTRAADRTLHDLIRHHSHNARLAAEIGRYVALYRTLREVRDARLQLRTGLYRLAENPEHLAIVEALAAGEGAAAAAAMERHIDEAAKTITEMLFA